MTQISNDVAVKEIERWLDAKKVSKAKRQSSEDSISALVAAVEDGKLLISDDGTILTQVLEFEIGSDNPVKQLAYKLRLTVDEIHKRMIGSQVKATDLHGTLRVYVCALTDQHYVAVGKMDTADYSLATTIAGFFM